MLGDAGLVAELAHHHGEAVRHGSRERGGAERQAARGVQRGADLSHRSLSRQGAGAEHPRVPLRQRLVRAHLESQLHRPRADRRAGDARPRQTLGASTNPPARIATWWSRTCSRSSAFMAMEPPTHLAPQAHQRREEQGVSQHAADPAHRRGARAVHRLSRRGGRRAGVRHRDLHRAQVLASTTGAGPACRSICAPASGWPKASASSRSRFASRRRACFPKAPASARTGRIT